MDTTFLLPVGVTDDQGNRQTEVTLMRTNGVAEKIFVDKKGGKPYTWMGRVVTVALASLGKTDGIGLAQRDGYARGNAVTIHPLVKNMSIADVNTCLVEIHRRVWKKNLSNQACICKWCTSNFTLDIDLGKLSMTDEELEKAALIYETKIQVKLPIGWRFKAPKATVVGAQDYASFDGQVFDQFTFRLPTLGDAIRREAMAKDSIAFWRRIAVDCVTEITSSETQDELPISIFQAMGTKHLDNEFDSEDLAVIRDALRDVPTMNFAYQEECPECSRETPVSLESTSFFSE